MEENTNQVADEKVGEQVEEKPSEKKTGWSWLGFFFPAYYYAGYGKVKRGLVYALLTIIPFAAIVIAIIGGMKARKDLPVGQIKFVWKNLIPIFLVMLLSVFISFKLPDLIGDGENQETTEQYESQYNDASSIPPEAQSEMTNDETPSKLNLCAVGKNGRVFESNIDFPFDNGIVDKYLSRVIDKNLEVPMGDVKIALKVSYYSEENLQCYMVNKFTISSKKDSKEETSSEKEDIFKLVRELNAVSFLF
jgi:hypothetical protein